MNIPWLHTLTDYIGIDLGTSRVRIWGKGSGLVVDDASAVAIDTNSQRVVAVGQEAAEMSGRVSKYISIVFPISADGVNDQEVAVAMLRALLQRVFRLGLFFRPVMVVSVHSTLGKPERQVLTEVFLRVGAREVYLVDEVLAAAIGSGVPVADASGSLFLHTGHMVTEVGMISLGSVVASQSLKFAGEQVTQLFQVFLKENYGLLVGTGRATQLKRQVLGQSDTLPSRIRITGQDLSTRSPKEIFIEGKTLTPICEQVALSYAQTTRQLLERVPPELSQDVLDKGMLLSGGSAQLTGLTGALVKHLSLPVSIVDQPEQAVILGLGQVVSNLRLFTESVGYRRES
jgi:rod shape-determining protein MreB and related proteins